MTILCFELSENVEPKFEPAAGFSGTQREALEILNAELARNWTGQDVGIVIDAGETESCLAAIALPSCKLAIAQVKLGETLRPKKIWVLRENEEVLSAGVCLLEQMLLRVMAAVWMFHPKFAEGGVHRLYWRNTRVCIWRGTGSAWVHYDGKNKEIDAKGAENSLSVREFFWRKFGVEITNPEDVKEVLGKL